MLAWIFDECRESQIPCNKIDMPSACSGVFDIYHTVRTDDSFLSAIYFEVGNPWLMKEIILLSYYFTNSLFFLYRFVILYL